MLVYQATKSEFMDDVERDVIVDHISRAFEQRVHGTNPAEVRSWQNSMQHMYKVLNSPDIPNTCGVAIEFGVPYTSSRIDFLPTGTAAPQLEEPSYDAAVIIELKQWSELQAVDGKDDLVRTFVGKANRVVTHPSYQAWSYARMIEDYNEAVRNEQIVLLPCAYLHNYHAAPDGDPLFDARYAESLASAPAFCAGDVFKLRAFICRHITRGDDGAVLYRIESGRLKPSKSLQDALSGMLEGNDEFVMIDDQKVVFETAAELARLSRSDGRKRVMIVRGGPGTGKSVVAVNLLVRLTAEEMVVQYVSKNSAPRNAYSRLLRARKRTKAYIDNLFRGSGAYYDMPSDSFDTLVVDEAHRLNERSGLYGNLGNNQTQELIDAARFSIFFIDERQRVTLKDAGSVAEIRRLAERAGAEIQEMALASQFRCNGSDSYLDWLDDALDIRPAADREPADCDYDFRVYDDPNDLMAAVVARNGERSKARVVAGYCWEWPTKTRGNRTAGHVSIPDHDFAKSWNLDSTTTWAIDDDSVDQVGCVHTSQGLEFAYVGVIIGDDMRFEHGHVVTDRSKRAKTDASLKGIGTIAKTDPQRADQVADEIIRNTYRVLMTRGMKGCFVYCTDAALAAHLKSLWPRSSAGAAYVPMPSDGSQRAAEDPLEG
jgi:DUF2075 family protein